MRWTEQRYVNGAPAGTERWNAVLSTVLQTPRTEQRLLKNPLGIYVNGLSWSRELDSSEGAKPMKLRFRLYVVPLTLLALAGCASQKPPPSISLDETVLAQPLPEPPKPVEVVAPSLNRWRCRRS